MINDLERLIQARHLAVPENLNGATVGVHSVVLEKFSKDISISVKKLAEKALKHGFRPIVFFDGPGRQFDNSMSSLDLRKCFLELYSQDIELFVAPGFAACQMWHMHRMGYLSHVAGAEEVFLWGDVPLVLDVYAEKFEVVHRAPLLMNLGASEQQFIEAALAVGCVLQPRPAPLFDPSKTVFEIAIQMAVSAGSLMPAITSGTDPFYVQQFIAAQGMVAWQLYMTDEGKVELTNKNSQYIPNDLFEITGYRLPDIYYYFLRYGIIGPELLRAVIWGKFTDDVHFAVQGQVYERYQRAQNSIRSHAISKLVQPLHRYYHARSIQDRSRGAVSQIQPLVERIIISKEPPSITDSASLIAKSVELALEEAGLKGVSTTNAPRAYLKQAKIEPTDALLDAQTLSLRLLLEAIIVWHFVTNKADVQIDKRELIEKMPWKSK